MGGCFKKFCSSNKQSAEEFIEEETQTTIQRVTKPQSFSCGPSILGLGDTFRKEWAGLGGGRMTVHPL